ncbi:hypothetical protein WJX73_000248 [Symbiochloris irregularis]|uniref:Uncharacterized protein n=1 Tax=Symbiochloris irregularis TaxID=706552 RepID=A0AAW1PRL7_9CHLO
MEMVSAERLRPSYADLPDDLISIIAETLRSDGQWDGLKAFRLACSKELAGALQAFEANWRRVFCEQLEELSLQKLDPALAKVFPYLKHVDLGKCPPLQAGQITALQALPRLTDLRALLADEEQNLAVAAEIAQLRGLTSLSVAGSGPLTDEDLEALARQGSLHHLNISECLHLSDAAIVTLGHLLPCLTCLEFSTSCRGIHQATSRLTDQACYALAALPALQSLDLQNHEDLTMAGVRQLMQLTNLTSLKLANSRGLTNAGLGNVKNLTGLKHLQLTYSLGQPAWSELFTAEMLTGLCPLTQLTSLVLQGLNWDYRPALPGKTLHLPHLMDLDLSHAGRRYTVWEGRRIGKLDSSGLQLFPLTQLTRLNVRSNRLDAGALPLPLPNLVHLNISSCGGSLPSTYLLQVSGLSRLQTLHMDDCEGASGQRDWAFLRHLSALTALSWSNRFGGPSWFASEAELDDLPRAFGLLQQAVHLRQLRRLCLSRQGLEPVAATMALLGRMTQLTSLDLAGTFCEEEEAFNSALSHLQPLALLRHLNLASTPLWGRGLANLWKLRALQELDLSKTALPDDCLRHLKPFHSLRNLSLDDQRLGDAITDEGLRKIAHISGLRSLSLQGNCSVTAQGLAALSAITSLRELDVRGCLNVQAHAALRYLQACSSLAVIELGEWDGVRHAPLCYSELPVVLEKDLKNLKRRLTFLRHIDFGGQVVTCKSQYVASCAHAAKRRLVIFSLKTFLRMEKWYTAAFDLPARGACFSLCVALGLMRRRAPGFASRPSADAPAAAQDSAFEGFFIGHYLPYCHKFWESWSPSETFGRKRKRGEKEGAPLS